MMCHFYVLVQSIFLGNQLSQIITYAGLISLPLNYVVIIVIMCMYKIFYHNRETYITYSHL